MTPSHLELASTATPDMGVISLSQHYAQMAQVLRPCRPFTCFFLGPEDVKSISRHPIAAGGSADIREGVHNGRKVALKCYRCYATSDITTVVERLCNEIRVWSLLYHGGVNVVPLVGVYSTETLHFTLVYEYAHGLDLQQYLKGEPSVGRLNLLTAIARDLTRMHGLGIVHGRLRAPDILIDEDGTPHLAGLGNAYILPNFSAWSGEDTDKTYHQAAELARQDFTSMHPTKADDMAAFGFMAFEVLTGLPPFPGFTETAAMYSVLKGDRPLRPNHGVTDRMWDMIEWCWHVVPSQRMSIGDVVDLLEAET